LIFPRNIFKHENKTKHGSTIAVLKKLKGNKEMSLDVPHID